MARPIVVLPEPDSPTKPNVSPLYMSKFTPFTALKGLRFEPNVTSKSLTLKRTSLLFFMASMCILLSAKVLHASA